MKKIRVVIKSGVKAGGGYISSSGQSSTSTNGENIMKKNVSIKTGVKAGDGGKIVLAGGQSHPIPHGEIS